MKAPFNGGIALSFPLFHAVAWNVDAVAEVLAALLAHEGKRPTLKGTVESEAEGIWAVGPLRECRNRSWTAYFWVSFRWKKNKFLMCSSYCCFFFFLRKILLKFVFIYSIFGCAGSSLLRVSVIVVSAGYSSLWCTGFSLWWLLLLWSLGSQCPGFSNCSIWAQ